MVAPKALFQLRCIAPPTAEHDSVTLVQIS
jgi:hypothetical protein